VGVLNKISRFFLNPTADELTAYFASLENDMVYRRLAIETCIDLIANAMLKVEYKTYEQNKRVKNDIYYRLNVSPNGKQNSSEFYKSLVHHLYYDNEVLVVSPGRNDSELFIADDFNVTEQALKPDRFDHVTVNNLQLDRSFTETDVIYLKLADTNIRSIIDSFYASYGKLLASAINIYKRNNARRFILKGDIFHIQDRSGQEKINKMMTAQFKPFFEADNAGSVFQLQDGFDLKDVSGTTKSDSRDIKNLLDDVIDTTSSAFHVPKGLMKGDMAGLSDQIDSFLIFTIHPLVALITDELNSKIYTMDEYNSGDFVRADTTNIKVTDVTSMATALDKLLSIGTMSVNDASEKVGTDPIDEEWANKRYITKNYSEAEQLINSLKGGEKENDSKEQTKQIRI